MQKPARLSQLREAVKFIKRYTAGEQVEWQGVKFQSEWCKRQLPVLYGMRWCSLLSTGRRRHLIQ